MLTSIHLKNFRALRDVKIEPLRRVNLITGQNDTGKTTVLEALRILLSVPFVRHQAGQTAFCGNLPNEFRGGCGSGDWNETFWKWLLYNKDPKLVGEISVSVGGGHEFGLKFGESPPAQPTGGQPLAFVGGLGLLQCYKFGQPPDPPAKAEIFTSHPSDPNQDALDYNRVIRKRGKKKVEEMLRKVNPRVESIESVHSSQQPGLQAQGPLIYVDVGLKEMIPVTQMGQGFNRLLSIYSEVIANEVNVLLIDEIENGLHYSVLPLVWEGLFNAVKELDVQLFATTHSRECIAAADAAARKASSYELNLIRLDRVGEDIKATVMNDKTLATAKELNWEMR
jgi:ABC-type branched-subunit amino acid transport system ATPase component